MNNEFSREAGELIVLCILLQVTLLFLVIKRGWDGIKATVAGLVAGITLMPMWALGQINIAIKEIQENQDYILIDNKDATTRLQVGNRSITLTTELAKEIAKAYPQEDKINPPQNDK